MSGGHLALASWTRFSPNTRWPAAMTGAMASAPKVLETATRVTSSGRRRATRQASAISRRTAARAAAGSGGEGGVIIAADPYRVATTAATVGAGRTICYAQIWLAVTA